MLSCQLNCYFRTCKPAGAVTRLTRPSIILFADLYLPSNYFVRRLWLTSEVMALWSLYVIVRFAWIWKSKQIVQFLRITIRVLHNATYSYLAQHWFAEREQRASAGLYLTYYVSLRSVCCCRSKARLRIKPLLSPFFSWKMPWFQTNKCEHLQWRTITSNVNYDRQN